MGATCSAKLTWSGTVTDLGWAVFSWLCRSAGRFSATMTARYQYLTGRSPGKRGSGPSQRVIRYTPLNGGGFVPNRRASGRKPDVSETHLTRRAYAPTLAALYLLLMPKSPSIRRQQLWMWLAWLPAPSVCVFKNSITNVG